MVTILNYLLAESCFKDQEGKELETTELSASQAFIVLNTFPLEPYGHIPIFLWKASWFSKLSLKNGSLCFLCIHSQTHPVLYLCSSLKPYFYMVKIIEYGKNVLIYIIFN